jgi:hypothetical protein
MTRVCVRGAKKCAYALQGIWLVGDAVGVRGAKSVRMPRRAIGASAVPVHVPCMVLVGAGSSVHVARDRAGIPWRRARVVSGAPTSRRPHSLPLSSLYSTPSSLSATRVCGASLYPGGLPPPPFFLPWGGGKRGPGAPAGLSACIRRCTDRVRRWLAALGVPAGSE